MDDDLVSAERIARIEIVGRRTGRLLTVPVGFVERPGGSLVVAASEADADWAANLAVARTATVAIGARRTTVAVELLEVGDPRRADAVRDLILRYGTPSERLGRGAVFVLTPEAPEPRV